jgi:hypothetical protein
VALLWRLKADAIWVILGGAGIGLLRLVVGG